MNNHTIDYIDNIVIDLDNPPMANYQALNLVPQGLLSLALLVQQEEAKKYPGDGITIVEMSRSSCPPMIYNAFFWFGTSVVNYVRLVGLLKTMANHGFTAADLTPQKDLIRKECRAYVESVIPDIQVWRNKVSAHFAATDPFNDNLGTLEQSIMDNITFMRNRFVVNGFTYVSNNEPSTLPQWSLTETFENLIPRYWPQCNYKTS